jgi:hypothetical protein
LGSIPSADQLDTRWEKLMKMQQDLYRMENSSELKDYEDLKNLVDSSAFQSEKRKIEGLRFSGSEEEQLQLEYKKLSQSADIRNYKKLAASGKPERLSGILNGSDLKRYLDLQRVVETEDFRIRKSALKKKEFIKSEDYKTFQEYKRLGKSADIRFWYGFTKTESYISYLKTTGSERLSHLEELRRMTSHPDFLERVAFLKDRKRFSKTEEYQSTVKLKELDKSKFMTDYRKIKKARELDFFEKWDILLDEGFANKELNTNFWQPENWWGYRTTGASFSQEGEMQGFNGMKNIQINSNTLSIWAKKEKLEGKVWNPALGLVPKSFDYTSSILNCADSFRVKEGVLEVKARFKRDVTVISSFSLTGTKPYPQVDLFRSTKGGVGMGVVENQSGRSGKYVKLNGLDDSKYHIYGLEIGKRELVWKINGIEVYRCPRPSDEPMFFNLLTSLHGVVNEHLLPHRFEIDWIRFITPKN